MSSSNNKYLGPDYCKSCAYFQQTKGNFGKCSDGGYSKAYDGTKKGSACSGWRIKTELVNEYITYLSTPEPPSRVEGYRDELGSREGLNSKAVIYDPTFRKHRYNRDIIKRALSLFSEGKGTGDIMKYLEEYAKVTPDRKAVRAWIIKFLGSDKWKEAHKKREFTPCSLAGCSGRILKNGIERNGKQRYRCSRCRKPY